ncbi:nitrite reductase [Salmonella enterica subsp. enterica serovar Tennessee]|nr:nitrite reductase [Salmonella enterica subsp. enterica serovar Tennessee]
MSQSEHSTVPLRPMPVKRLAAAAGLVGAACVGGYLLAPKREGVGRGANGLAGPPRGFSNPQTPEGPLSRGQEKIPLLINISEPTRKGMISYAAFCFKKKKTHDTGS